MAFQIKIDHRRARATLYFAGQFDLQHGFALFQYCQMDGLGLRHYRIDLKKVTDLTDFGLSALKKFIRWGAERGMDVHIINPKPEHRELCRQWGILVYTPTDYPLLPRFKNRGDNTDTNDHAPLPEDGNGPMACLHHAI